MSSTNEVIESYKLFLEVKYPKLLALRRNQLLPNQDGKMKFLKMVPLDLLV